MKKGRCTFCKSFFLKDKMIIVPIGKFCTRSCLLDYANKNTSNLIKKSQELERKKHIQDKKKLKYNDLQWQHKQTQKAFNRLRILQELKWFKDRKLVPYCISCGKENMDWCCGHYKTVGAYSELRYSENNTFLQCNRYCNKGLSGNITGTKRTIGYQQGLINRFGKRFSDKVINPKSFSKKWTCDELESLRKQINIKIRGFK